MSDDIPTYCQINNERFRERRKAWALANKDKIRESNKRWRDKNKERLKQQQTEYNKTGYYKSKLIQRFNVLKDELLINNDSNDLLIELSNVLDEMQRLNIIDDDEYNNLKKLF